MIRVRDVEELNDLIRGFLHLPLPKGDRIGVLTYTGGGGIIAVDQMMEQNLPLPSLSPETMSKLSSLIPSWLPLGNPVDVWPSVMKYGARPMYRTYLRALLEDENVDAALCIFLTPRIPGQESFDVSEEIIDAAIQFPTKPIVVWAYGPNLREMGEKLESSKRVVFLPSAERAVQVLSALMERRKFLERNGRFAE
jgi:acetyltransferase